MLDSDSPPLEGPGVGSGAQWMGNVANAVLTFILAPLAGRGWRRASAVGVEC